MDLDYWLPDQFEEFKRQASRTLAYGTSLGVLPNLSAAFLRFDPEFKQVGLRLARVITHLVDLHDPLYAGRVHPSDTGDPSAVVGHHLAWIYPQAAPVTVDRRELRRVARQPGGALEVFNRAFNRLLADAEAECDRREALRPPRPRPRLSGVTPRGAEHLVCEWMRHLGVDGAEVTQQSVDGGIDVTSSTIVAQVKHYAAPVGVEALRALHGVAVVLDRSAAFFALTGYTKRAVDFGDDARIPLFTYDPERAVLRAVNFLAVTCLSAGFGALRRS
ncbi:restriction endonuclease [Microbacterium sp. NPDC058021]|uniref:restriction endonuclease n=1 Tax=Microbacterium sp. NPDC058021 TaxID=3346306 RepID=UPI0036D879B6